MYRVALLPNWSYLRVAVLRTNKLVASREVGIFSSSIEVGKYMHAYFDATDLAIFLGISHPGENRAGREGKGPAGRGVPRITGRNYQAELYAARYITINS